MHLLKGPDLGHYRFVMKLERREEKNGGLEPTTSRVFAPEAHVRSTTAVRWYFDDDRIFLLFLIIIKLLLLF